MNKRRSFFNKSLLSLAGLSLMPTILKATQKDKVINGRFIHMVFFWLKPETDIADFQQATENFLMQVPEIVNYHLGEPAGTPREVVNNTYSVSLVVTFASKEDQDIYQKHQAHLKYIEENKDKWTDVKIFDSWGKED